MLARRSLGTNSDKYADLAFFSARYNIFGRKAQKRLPLTADGPPLAYAKGGVKCMVTYDSLFTYTLVIIAIITLVLACKSRDK